jgi:metal-responsive CopG/Arc/MetJ family transcriptional regulator
MKTAISIPDDVFKRAERLARQRRKSRSRLFSEAIQEYLTRHAPEEITEAMDRVCLSLGRDTDQDANCFHSIAARRILEKSEW